MVYIIYDLNLSGRYKVDFLCYDDIFFFA